MVRTAEKGGEEKVRLWHKDLIPYLPRQQLIGQWRECCAIAKSIAENGTPNHVLVNRIIDYPMCHFSLYSEIVFTEMMMRGYSPDSKKFTMYLPLGSTVISKKELFGNWHNERYYWQCYFNLQEKFDCGAIPSDEFDKIPYPTEKGVVL